MGREIKFRAWYKKRREMLLVVDIYFGRCETIQAVRLLADHDGMKYPTNEQTLDDVNLMQYTGLKDKNGVEIYEGDIVYYPDNGSSTVKLERGCFWLNGHILGHLNVEGLETIGNIYENPELLHE